MVSAKPRKRVAAAKPRSGDVPPAGAQREGFADDELKRLRAALEAIAEPREAYGALDAMRFALLAKEALGR